MAKALVIVESPAKAKTINKFLGRGYDVKASMGHIRDLPKKTLGVDEETFEPTYQVLTDKKKAVADLKKAAKSASAVYLASDPDREGEAICWHLQEELRKDTKAPFHRVLFHEITKKAIQGAFEHPLEIDANKVDAQQARRILDRLVGYKISPLLWDKVRRGLSAGRVQSVALRIICEREREIRAFVAREYWSLGAQLAASEPPPFVAKLVAKDGKKIELVSKDEVEGALTDLGWRIRSTAPTPDGGPGAITIEVEPASAKSVPFRVTSVQSKEKKKNPQPPFITSKLQQDAARQLGYPVAKTMRLAQGLYEGRELGDAGSIGLITYMRTDSTRVADEAISSVRTYIAATYGDKSLPAEPRQYKVGKQAQEAHEAIRPTSLEYPPDAVKAFLGRDEFRLYQLIWNRFVASQMESAVFDTTRADISAGPFTFRATGSVLRSAGWLAVYQEGQDEDRNAEREEEESEDAEDRRLPPLKEGQALDLKSLLPKQHFTQPPPRFTEATLVKELEENGIGRPSTYASILSTIQDRDYVEKDKGRFNPTELGFLVNDLMVQSFGDIVDVGYTARMEDELDEIEEGRLNWIDALREFQGKFEKDLARAKKEMRNVKAEAIPTDQVCEKCGKPMVLKWGRFGQFLACSGYPECKNTRRIRMTKEGKAEAKADVLLDETCPRCSSKMALKQGRFGEFTACSNYPACKYIKMKETGVPCPECGKGAVVERRSKRGKIFFGCDRYPDCSFVLWNRPVNRACPECARPYLVEKVTKKEGRRLICEAEGCGYAVAEEETEAVKA